MPPTPDSAADTARAFTLDTSGQVIVNQTRIMWSDLDPFTQGYMEAMFANGRPLIPLKGDSQHPFRVPGFSDVAPETLATILKDCAKVQHPNVLAHCRLANNAGGGTQFWEDRQAGLFPAFPPLTLTLSDAGKLVFA